MSEGPSEPSPTVPSGAGERQPPPGRPAREQVTQPRLVIPPDLAANPPTQPSSQPYQPTVVAQPHQPTEVVQQHQPTEVDPRGPVSRTNATIIAPIPASAAPPEAVTLPPATQVDAARYEPPTEFAPDPIPPAAQAASRQPASEVLRYGPGVPPSQAGVSAEQVWRTGQVPAPPGRPVRLRRLAGTLLTVALLVAAGVLLFFRFHHGPFQVTGVKITSVSANGCAVNVTGRISTNGQPGTVSYEWVFTPQQGAPQPLSESVPSGQHAAYVTVAVQGQGHGTATQKVALQLLGPNQKSDSTVVRVSC